MQKINWELSKKKPLGGFTLIEVLVVVFVLSMGVLVIMQGINKTTTYISETAQRTIALNLAKEGLEAMYNIRNTNWRRRSDSRDKCWLKANPMVDEGNDGCANDRWFWWFDRHYIEKDEKHQNYYVVPINWDTRTSPVGPRWSNGLDYEAEFFNSSTRLNGQLNTLTQVAQIKNYNDLHRKYAVHFLDGERISHEEFLRAIARDPAAAQREEKQYWTYWRFVTVGGLYDKNNLDYQNAGLVCKNWLDDSGKCWDSSPKELRFCSIVLYTAPYRGMVHICSIMTNFLK